jgi:hypothetical protein
MATIFAETSIPYKRPTLLFFTVFFTWIVTGCNEAASTSQF